MANIDCRIAGEIEPVIVKAGETFQLTLTIKDAAAVNIDLTGFTVGPLTIYKGSLIKQIFTGVSVVGGLLVFKDIIRSDLKKNTTTGYYCKCPLLPPGGSPAAMFTFKMLVYE